MKAILSETDLSKTECDALVVGVDDDWKSAAAIQELDAAAAGWLERQLQSGEISTKLLKTTQLVGVPGIKANILIVVGLGERAKYDARLAYQAAATGVKLAAAKNRSRVAIGGIAGDPLQQRSAVAGSVVGGVGQDLFRKEKNLHPAETLLWNGVTTQACVDGQIIGESINLTRRLVNLPAGHIYPQTFAEEAVSMANESGLDVEVWDENRLEQERCHSLLAVGQGSTRPSRLVKLIYHGTNSKSQPVALVGKGVTFDSGGLSIKTTENMLTMKCDMAGAATVLGIMRAIAKLKPERSVIGLMGLAENMISGNSFKLGDVLTARSGKTIEIHNTDAEGRLVLADVLDVAREASPQCIVDFATLTGACVVALGNDVAGLMTNNAPWQAEIQQSAEKCGEYVWPLPMFPFYTEQIAGKVADIKNVGEGRWGGAITAAKFLEEFVGDVPWTHVDIAGPAFLDSPKSWCDAGATGCMVRTMIELLTSKT